MESSITAKTAPQELRAAESGDAAAQYNLGVTCSDLGRHQEAIEACKQTIRIEPNFARAHYSLGVAYLSLGDKDSALEQYKILKTLNVEQADHLFNLIYK